MRTLSTHVAILKGLIEVCPTYSGLSRPGLSRTSLFWTPKSLMWVEFASQMHQNEIGDSMSGRCGQSTIHACRNPKRTSMMCTIGNDVCVFIVSRSHKPITRHEPAFRHADVRQTPNVTHAPDVCHAPDVTYHRNMFPSVPFCFNTFRFRLQQ